MKSKSLLAVVIIWIVGAAVIGSTTFTVVDTGQSSCFDDRGQTTCPQAGQAFYGQDAQYQGNQPDYIDNGDGTITDRNTGLMWQQGFTQVDWTAAEAEAAAAATGGYTDWRVPTIKELYSLIDFDGNQGTGNPSSTVPPDDAVPFIDTSFFDFEYPSDPNARYIDVQFVTSTVYTSLVMNGQEAFFGVNVADGRIKGYPQQRSVSYYGRYVRGGSDYGENDYTDNNNGTVTDRATGLMWLTADSGAEHFADDVSGSTNSDGSLNWEESLAFCEDLSFADVGDWRLPDAKELHSILDYSRSPDATGSAAIDPVFETSSIINEMGVSDFPFFWTSTSFLPGSDAVIIIFGEALGYMNGQFLDVHGAGCQRTDPKTGSASWGNGPQGDVRRVYNYARCVRNAETTTTTSDTSYLPAVAHIQGSAYFSSRIEAFNNSDEAMTVQMVFAPRVDLGGATRSASLNLESKQMLSIDDPLSQWFGISSDAVGSVAFEVSDGANDDLLLSSIIFAVNDDGSEYGQYFPATQGSKATAAGQTAYLATTVDGQRMRVNFGAMATEDSTLLKVSLLDADGVPVGSTRTLELDTGVSQQLNDLEAEFDGLSIEDSLVSVEVVAGAAIVYNSVLDGNSSTPGTSDPTTIQPVITGATTVTLLELGSIQGYDEFAGSATVSNLSDSTTLVQAELYIRDDPGLADSADFILASGQTRGFPDLLGELFGVSGSVGTVVLQSSEPQALMASGREYSILSDADGEVQGTAGQLIPGMSSEELLQAGNTYHLLGLRQRSIGTDLERSHVAAFNPGSSQLTVRLDLYDGDTAAFEGSTTIILQGYELTQLNDVIEGIKASQDGSTKRLEVVCDAAVYLAAFRVNSSGDPVTITALE